MSEIGRHIAELRQAKGWSQNDVVTRLEKVAGMPLTRGKLSRWENGHVTPGPFWIKQLATVFDCPSEVLEGTVDRRKFLSHMAATAVAPAVASDLLLSGFSAKLRQSAFTPDDWEGKLLTYGADYMRMGAGEIQQRLAGDLVVLQQQLDTPRAWAVAARLMTLFAKTFPGSDGNKAVVWYRMAAEAADRSEDTDIRVWVRGRAAIALGYEGASLPTARMFADQALGVSEKPSLGRLNALWGKAHAWALEGNRSGALELIDAGRREFDASGSDEQTSDYAVPWWRVNVFLSLLAARLGNEPVAVKAQEDASVELPAELPRFATHLKMHRGLMLARAGDKQGGIQLAQAALDELPPEKHSLTLRMLMDEIRS